jgi:hypothetical protein
VPQRSTPDIRCGHPLRSGTGIAKPVPSDACAGPVVEESRRDSPGHRLMRRHASPTPTFRRADRAAHGPATRSPLHVIKVACQVQPAGTRSAPQLGRGTRSQPRWHRDSPDAGAGKTARSIKLLLRGGVRRSGCPSRCGCGRVPGVGGPGCRGGGSRRCGGLRRGPSGQSAGQLPHDRWQHPVSPATWYLASALAPGADEARRLQLRQVPADRGHRRVHLVGQAVH